MILGNNLRENITIIGAGALGTNLALALYQQNYTIKGIFNRTVVKAQRLAEQVKAEYTGKFPQSTVELGDIIFLCVPDDQLKIVTHQFVEKFENLEGKYFVHCSGARGASEIKDLKTKNAFIASFHPIQTFVSETRPKIFKNTNISLQGDEPVVKKLVGIADSLQAAPFIVSEEDKLLLHIAAVFACNYMVTVSQAAVQTIRQTSDPKNITLDKILPLMIQTLNNIQEIGPEKSLSGPLKRGDTQTIEAHFNALKNQPDLISLYKALGKFTLTNITKKESDNPEGYNELIHLFLENYTL